MLILTRRPAETIYMTIPGYPEPVTVTVLGVVGNQVRFGIQAPRTISVDRAEIYERKRRGLPQPGHSDSPPPSAEPSDPEDDDRGNR